MCLCVCVCVMRFVCVMRCVCVCNEVCCVYDDDEDGQSVCVYLFLFVCV